MNRIDYQKNFELRYGIKGNNFLNGFLSFFGIAESPYRNAIKKILNTSVDEALREDTRQLNRDFYNALEKHKTDLPDKMADNLHL